MKIGGPSLAFRWPRRVAALHDRLARARYFRGHGVHSPFVYRLVREVFMRSELLPGDRALYRALLAVGVAPQRAVQLQNLAIHCGCASFGLNRADADLCVATRELPRAETLALVQAASAAGHTVVVLDPYASAQRQALCGQLVAAHRSTAVDNRAYLLIFNNHLPKQYFRL